MDRNFRMQTLCQLGKTAGVLEDFVQKKLQDAGISIAEGTSAVKPISYAHTIQIPGASVDIPTNPFGPHGEVNFMFIFRYSGDTRKNAGSSGINTVNVYSDIGPAYNKPDYISNSIAKVLAELKTQNPNAKLGHYGLTGFSGGYYPIENILDQRQRLVSLVGKEPDAVILADAGHTKLNPAAMKGFLEYAQEASDPASGKKFVDVHSAIVPERYNKQTGKSSTYTSTTQHAQWLLDHMDMSRNNLQSNDQRFQQWNMYPKSIANKGNFTVIQADDQANRNYNPQNTQGSSGWVHLQIAKDIPLIWRNYLQDWNQD